MTPLTTLLSELEEAAHALGQAETPTFLGALEKLKAIAWSRLTVRNGGPHEGDGDRLLSIDEAAERLGVTRDWLRRRPDMPFVLKLSDGVVRYSSRAIGEYIAGRIGETGRNR